MLHDREADPAPQRAVLLVPLLGRVWPPGPSGPGSSSAATLQEGWQPLPPRPVRPRRPSGGRTAAVDEPAEPDARGARGVRARRRAGVRPGPVPPARGPFPPPPPSPSVTAPALPDCAVRPRLGACAAPTARRRTPDYAVKGKTATRVFYAPGSPYYARTRADVWFRTADDARAAGFTARAPRRSS